jgi:hypothetical protein
MLKDKKIAISKKMMVKEHERLVPELEKAGLKKEAKEQEEDLRKYKKA